MYNFVTENQRRLNSPDISQLPNALSRSNFFDHQQQSFTTLIGLKRFYRCKQCYFPLAAPYTGSARIVCPKVYLKYSVGDSELLAA